MVVFISIVADRTVNPTMKLHAFLLINFNSLLNYYIDYELGKGKSVWYISCPPSISLYVKKKIRLFSLISHLLGWHMGRKKSIRIACAEPQRSNARGRRASTLGVQ